MLFCRLPARRLAWAASNLVYKKTEYPLYGPFPNGISLTGPSGLTISFTGSMKPVSIDSDRFMVCCLQTMEECDKVLYGRGWQGVTITGTEHLYSDILSL